ncbi:hypothetical protein [Curtobacterium flaccumfaciens]|nr:hypothetical protein [Curtobacterium flaccumfaciens]MCX2797915.1 hypothetical protein [Curtobacterium flaccumfaciens pv. flaccumfaciens]
MPALVLPSVRTRTVPPGTAIVRVVVDVLRSVCGSSSIAVLV